MKDNDGIKVVLAILGIVIGLIMVAPILLKFALWWFKIVGVE